MKPDRGERAGEVLLALLKSGCYVGLFLGMQIFVMLPTVITGIIQANLDGEADEVYGLLTADAQIYTLVSGLITIAVVLAVYLIRRKPLGEALWLRRVDGRTLWTGAALAPGLFLVVSLALAVLPEEWTESYNEAASSISTASLVGFLAVVAVAPVVEELIFRGLMVNRLSCVMPGWLAVVLAAAVFGACHGHPVWFGYAFVLGCVFGFIDLRAGSIWPSILGHMVFNSFSQILNLLPQSEEGTEVLAALGIIVLMAIALPILDRRGIAALFRRKPQTEPVRELSEAPGVYEFDPWDE